MGRIRLPLSSNNENVRTENATINCLQFERVQLIESLLYKDGVEDFLVTLSKNIRQIALDSVPLKKNTQWLTTWSTNLESRLNNYKCAGNWLNDFQLLVLDNISVETQRLVGYMMLEKMIRITFKQAHIGQYHSQLIPNYTESWIVPEKIVNLEPAEASKFQYIVGWTIYKLTKSDALTLAHKEFAKIKLCLNVLSSEHVEYIYDTRSKTTTIIPGTNFTQFMYYLESLILQLFEKHIEYGPNILIYINNNLLGNQPLKEQFNGLLQIAYKLQYEDQELPSELIRGDIQLTKETENYLLTRLINVYMRSRQRSWRRFMEYIPEKGSSSLRENVKAMNADLKKNATEEDKPKKKCVTFKKGMLPEDLDLALCQLKIWARDNGAKSAFEKAFTLPDLKTLIQAFQNEPVKIKGKKKSVLIDLLFNHLQNSSEFNEETKKKGRLFT